MAADFDHFKAMDWFYPAFDKKCSVHQSLQKVIDIEKFRIELAQALQRNLSPSQAQRCDLLTDLRRRIAVFHNTLQFRLGMLAPERRGAWFRESMKATHGPFGTQLLDVPVFNEFKVEAINQLKTAIIQGFKEGSNLKLPFLHEGECLWSTLLQLKSEYTRICELTLASGRRFQLETLADSLPTEIDSLALRTFLLNVKQSLLGARTALDECYHELWTASLTFWNHMAASETQREKARFQSHTETQREKARFQSHTEAHRQRESIRQRRASMKDAPPPLSIKERRALEFMALADYPDQETLKKRYRQLARKLHPDAPGGKEEEFKKLTEFYEVLSDGLKHRSRPSASI
jgi:hypothetical protein